MTLGLVGVEYQSGVSDRGQVLWDRDRSRADRGGGDKNGFG